MMWVFLCLFFVDTHSTLATSIIAFTIICFMFHDANTLNLLSAIDARNHDVRTSSLMHIDILAETLCLARWECLTFHRLKIAELIMILYFLIIKRLLAAKWFVFAHELHRLKLLFYFLFYVYESGFLALHRTLACFFSEFI